MNTKTFTDSRFDDARFTEARLTAYALGELEGDERAEVERLLADPARHEELRAVEEIGRMAAALRSAGPTDELTRSPSLRRAVVAAIAATGNNAEGTAAELIAAQQPPHRRGNGWMPWRFAIAGSLVASLLVLVTAFVMRSTEFAARPRREIAQRGPATEEQAARPAPVNEQETAEKQAAVKPAVEQTDKSQVVAAPAAPRPGVDGLSVRTASEAAQLAAPANRAPAAARRESLARTREAMPGLGAPKAAADRDSRERDMRSFRVSVEPREEQTGERYARFAENRPRSPSEAPLSTFSIDVDTASYANVRRFLTSGRLPPTDAVRIEELVNYFRYDYPQPAGDRPFSVTLESAECPWHSGRRLVRVGLQGRDIDRRERPAGNLVFLVDVSGSMGDANKLPLVKQGLAMLVEELAENDSVAIVTYAGNAGLKLPATSGDQKGKILAAIDSLSPGGSTHGSAGLNLAYEQAAERFIPGGVNRVILATDGDLNVGVTSDAALVDLIKQKAAGGTFLTVLGFGEGNLQDEKMEKLADNGNGVYAYIDGAREARKVLVEQLTGSTITIAKDVKIQVEFNPAQVASYRLIGYENRIMAAQDFRDDRKDAGEIGAGHSVTALYEIELVGDGGEGPAGAEPLKYQPAQPKPAPSAALLDREASRELLTVKLRWKKPDGDESILDEVPLVDRGGSFEKASGDLRFAAAVAAFGMVLRDSEYKGEATLPLVAKIAGGSLGPDAGGYRAEFLDLVRKAESLRSGGR